MWRVNILKIKEFHSELNAFEVYNLFKNQKTRGIDLVLERATLVLAVAFFVLIIIAACIYM